MGNLPGMNSWTPPTDDKKEEPDVVCPTREQIDRCEVMAPEAWVEILLILEQVYSRDIGRHILTFLLAGKYTSDAR